ncbi:flavin-containing monooxygenase [Mycobacteroides abscessus]
MTVHRNPPKTLTSPKIAIIGAGASGICMGAQLRQAGFNNFVIYERNKDVGGVWHANTYPGLWCDVPNTLYCYTFAPNHNWGHLFANRDEIHTYLRTVASDHHLHEHLRINTEVTGARYHDRKWWVTTKDNTEAYDLLICATGILVNPAIPDIPGRDTFAGTAFHSARWDHGAATEGKRIAIVGNGSTGVQLVSALAPTAQNLTLFQRTPQWILPLPNLTTRGTTRPLHTYTPHYTRITQLLWRTVFEAIIGQAAVQAGWQRRLIALICRQYLRTVHDPGLRAKLTPDYQAMCKRLVRSTSFYQTVQRPNVDVITDPIAAIEPAGIRTRDRVLHEVDIIIYATGFRGTDFMRPMTITGPNGLTLDQAWRQGPRTYNSIAIPGFPNLFIMAGPNSPYSHDSVLRTAETHAHYILQWAQQLRSGAITTASPTENATAQFQQRLRKAMPHTVFSTGCSSWYQTPEGEPLIWPWSAAHHRQLLNSITLTDFHTTTT